MLRGMIAVMIVLFCGGAAHAAIQCPESSRPASGDSLPADTSFDNLLRLGAYEFTVAAGKVTDDVLAKRTDGDGLALGVSMFAAFCHVLRDDAAMEDGEKLARLRAFTNAVLARIGSAKVAIDGADGKKKFYAPPNTFVKAGRLNCQVEIKATSSAGSLSTPLREGVAVSLPGREDELIEVNAAFTGAPVVAANAAGVASGRDGDAGKCHGEVMVTAMPFSR